MSKTQCVGHRIMLKMGGNFFVIRSLLMEKYFFHEIKVKLSLGMIHTWMRTGKILCPGGFIKEKLVIMIAQLLICDFFLKLR